MKQEQYAWPTVPYHVRISVARQDKKYKHPSDPRYNGWREVWAKSGVELFDKNLSKKLRGVYLDQTLDMADALPMVNAMKRGLTVSTYDGDGVSCKYAYYGKDTKCMRIGVEIALATGLF